MTTICTSTPIDLSLLPDAVVLPIDADMQGIYSAAHGVLHIIDIESVIPLQSFVGVSDASCAEDILRARGL